MQRGGAKRDDHPPPAVVRFSVTSSHVEWCVTGSAVSCVVRFRGTPFAEGGDTCEVPHTGNATGDWTLHAKDRWGRTAEATLTIA